MLIYELIKKKRDGCVLSSEELDRLVEGYVSGEIPDYQMSAFLMAVFFRGMEPRELGDWTRSMVHSGEVIGFSGEGPYVDKHSTGGIGDKVSIPMAPVAAELGVHVPMISGRGLGHTGGTLDKLESIPGYRTDLSVETFERIVDEVGCCIIGQTRDLAPADKKLYALRDVTATVDSIPLIASSILSKKKASGIGGLVMDVKTGSGAFMKRLDLAGELAETLVSLGGTLGLRVQAYITEMGQPLGRLVGNALEIQESIEVLRGEGPEDTVRLVVEFAAAMAVLGGKSRDMGLARRKAEQALSSGAALRRFERMVEAQGGDPRITEDLSLLVPERPVYTLRAPRTGYVASMDCEQIGLAVVALGGGRRRILDTVDPSVGLVVHARIGDPVQAGDALMGVVYGAEDRREEAVKLLESAYALTDEPVEKPELIKASLRTR